MTCPYLKSSLFSSEEWFRTEFREFAFIFFPRNGIPSCFLFRWRDRKGIPRVCFQFFYGTEFRLVFSFSEVFGREFREFTSIFVQRNGIPSCSLFPGRVQNGNFEGFLFRGTAGIPSEITCSVYFVFRGINFLSEIPYPNWDSPCTLTPSGWWKRLGSYCWWWKGLHYAQYTLHVHTAGGGKGILTAQSHPYTASGGKGYNLHVHTSGGEKGNTLHSQRRLLMVLLFLYECEKSYANAGMLECQTKVSPTTAFLLVSICHLHSCIRVSPVLLVMD
jgi:hypothetical protein